MKDVETIVRENLYKMLQHKPDAPAAVDIKKRLTQEYGLTSLDRILFMTAVCEEAAVPLMAFTAEEINSLATAESVINSLNDRCQ